MGERDAAFVFFYSTCAGNPVQRLDQKAYCAPMSRRPSDPDAPLGRSLQAGRELVSVI